MYTESPQSGKGPFVVSIDFQPDAFPILSVKSALTVKELQFAAAHSQTSQSAKGILTWFL
jgi:hypothetical protein